ncbi:MAG: methyltransferase domain-containing protein [Gemmatimonadales bacterium]|nr:methyltransferase domain-containing protein [Gemmatimonadales bacterium]
MTWCAVDVRSAAPLRDPVTTWLVERTGQAVEERDDGSLVAFAENESSATRLILELRSRFGEAVAGESRPLPMVDWNDRWRDGLAPRRIGRLTVTPSWMPAPGPATLVIDPESAFGTGEHGSTRSALALLDRYVQPGHRVLDLGSGSGILAIAAVLLGASRASGIEIDDEAEPIALANAARNGVADRVTFLTGDAAALAPLLGPVDLVLSNILRGPNVALLPAIRAALAPQGIAIFAGMELPERELFLPELGAAGFCALDEARDEGWWAIAARPG